MILKSGIGNVIDPGLKDAPLTHNGKIQAEVAGRKLAQDILRGKLPRVELMGVSPLRRALHTSRILIDSADAEVTRTFGGNRGFRWWVGSSESSQRSLRVLPYLRECRTTAADQPSMKPEQALEFLKSLRNLDLHTVNRREFPSVRDDETANRPATQARIGHFLTIGLTKPCRKVDVESLASVNRRIRLLESWLHSRPERVIMLVGHNMIFKSWQAYWQRERAGVRWATRSELEDKLGEINGGTLLEMLCCSSERRTDEMSTDDESPSDSPHNLQLSRFEEMLEGEPFGRRKVRDCANTEFLIVRWTPK